MAPIEILKLAALALYVGWIVINIMIANERGRNVLLTFLTSVLLSPLLAYLYLIATPIIPPKSTSKPS